MKKKILMALLCLSISTMGFAQEIINYFEVDDNIATPVTIKTSIGTYQISDGTRIDGNLYSVEAWDANGNKIVNTQPYKTEIGSNKPTIRRYRFKDIKKSSTNSTDEELSSDNDNRGVGSQNSWEDIGHAVGGLSRIPLKGCPNLQVRGGLSLRCAEFISAKAELGGKGGMVFAGGFGKRYFPKEDGNSFFGEWLMYVANNDDGYDSYAFGVHYGHASWGSYGSDAWLGVKIEYSHFFKGIPRLGYFLNGFFGILRSTEGPCIDVGAGISWKLLSK